ncbi:MAG: helix-turn-helix domain-containing protein [Chloroflexi bacterium]|nr:helix-turn-helix domain-containing protein [Chloroflexota bacterium]
MANPEGMLTVAEVAHRMGRSTEQVRRYLREKKLPGERIGHQWFVPQKALEEEEMDRLTERRLAIFEEVRALREEVHKRLGREYSLEELMDEAREVTCSGAPAASGLEYRAMGTFRQRISIAPLSGGEFQELDALVDTGSTYTFVPRSLTAKLGIMPEDSFPFVLADGRRIEYPVAWVRVRLDGRQSLTICVFGEEDTQPLLGSFTLEAFRLAVDTVNKRLIPVPGLLVGVTS